MFSQTPSRNMNQLAQQSYEQALAGFNTSPQGALPVNQNIFTGQRGIPVTGGLIQGYMEREPLFEEQRMPIPRTIHEARNVLHLINPQQTNYQEYNINELRAIADNLEIPSGGDRDKLVNNIRNYIKEWYGI